MLRSSCRTIRSPWHYPASPRIFDRGRLPRQPDDGVRWARADIRCDDLLTEFRGADVVVHLAWLFQPTHWPLQTWRANVQGTERVLRAVAQAGVPSLIYASSVGAYSPAHHDDPVGEDWPIYPGAWTSSGVLSGRNPRQDGWRRRPSPVRSVNDTSPTSAGSTQIASFTGAATVGVCRRSGPSLAWRSSSMAWVKPVPTLPM
ncbi:hypothetical protein C5E45_13145 [Nocardia nova]|uniref:NAD-dependent epimerase/dehydratase domain-containing protein n=1 Tax=Nocardia nova TaxID=37330 RepID=A0A2S6ARD8_9NOCA|nr:hypothetical protein C5E41_28285 [Nocardia nova]PPJ37812.1 hypothetical protein C5E45_13145 [Nocardia nova]